MLYSLNGSEPQTDLSGDTDTISFRTPRWVELEIGKSGMTCLPVGA